MDALQWYSALQKPFFALPAWMFSPIWLVLYVIIILSFGYAFWQVLRDEWNPDTAIPFIINLAANVSFFYLQFTLHNNFLALLDIAIILASIIWILFVVYPLSRWVFCLQILYFLWMCYAAVLQASIISLN